MRILAYANLTKKHYFEKTKLIIDKLAKHHEVFCYDHGSELGLKGYRGEEVELIVSIGGDGTLLRAGKLAISLDVPIVGINGGRLGYLCAYGFKEFLKEDADFKKLKISERSLLEYGGHLAINEFMVTAKNYGSTIDLKMVAGEDFLYRANGLIISTPTGSTGINASAYGKVLGTHEKSFALTPICPCAYQKEGLVIGDDASIEVYSNRKGEAGDIYCDGVIIGSFKDYAVFRKSSLKLKLLTK